MKIGFVGLGAMGSRMAKVLIEAGHDVSGFDLNADAVGALKAAGGAAASSAAEAAKGADACVLVVMNGAQAKAALFGPEGIASTLTQGAVIVSCVTMGPADAEEFGARAHDAGFLYLDAPVSGGTKGAETGSLTFMASGSDAAWAASAPLLAVMGANLYRMGDAPGAGSTMKTVHQLAAGTNLAVAAECMSFGAHLGLDPAQVLEILNVSAGASWMIANRGPRMLEEGVVSHSDVDIFVKDLGLVLDAARASRFPVPVSAAALQVFLGSSGAGFGRHDDSQATRFYESLGGKKVRRQD